MERTDTNELIRETRELREMIASVQAMVSSLKHPRPFYRWLVQFSDGGEFVVNTEAQAKDAQKETSAKIFLLTGYEQ